MSHQPERKDKNCLNCGTTVAGRYCQVCGQENIVTKQSFWALSKHFVYDIFHFDGKFFDTLKLLFFKPGIISREYVSGRRMKYLDPIRMYLFTSALFFLVFFSISASKEVVKMDEDQIISKAERLSLAMEINQQEANRPSDTILKKQRQILLDSTYTIGLTKTKDTTKRETLINYKGEQYRLIAQKDSLVSPFVSSNDTWLQSKLQQKWNNFKKKYSDDLEKGLGEFLNGVLHKLPYLLFVSLPFFAAILKLLYIRKKQFFYSDHAVFTLHHYIISFILMLLAFAFNKLLDVTQWGIFGFLMAIVIVSWPLYLLVGMKRFYQQGWLKTVGKFFLLNFLGFITIMLLLLFFVFFSIFQL